MQLPQQLVELFRLRRTPMPFVHVLGQGGAAIALDGVADDDADSVGGRDKRLLERVDVVAVGLDRRRIRTPRKRSAGLGIGRQRPCEWLWS